MTKLIVKYREGDSPNYVNIPAETIVEANGFVCAYIGNSLVGVFDLGVVDMVYLSGECGR